MFTFAFLHSCLRAAWKRGYTSFHIFPLHHSLTRWYHDKFYLEMRQTLAFWRRIFLDIFFLLWIIGNAVYSWFILLRGTFVWKCCVLCLVILFRMFKSAIWFYFSSFIFYLSIVAYCTTKNVVPICFRFFICVIFLVIRIVFLLDICYNKYLKMKL